MQAASALGPRLARASLIGLSLFSAITALVWVFVGYQFPRQWEEYGQNQVWSSIWPHVEIYLDGFFPVWEEWFGTAHEPSAAQFGIIIYPIVAIILCSALISCLLLMFANRNRVARLLAAGLASGAWFLAYTFVLRVYVFVGHDLTGLALDYLAALSVVGSLFLLSRFFSIYPNTLDYAACSAILEKQWSPFVIPRLDAFAQKVNSRIEDLLRKWLPGVLFIKPFGIKGTWGFYDSFTYFWITLVLVFVATILWQIPTTTWIGWVAIYLFLNLMAFIALWNGYFKLNAQYQLGDGDDRRRIEWIYLSACSAVAIFLLMSIAFGTNNILIDLGMHTPFEHYYMTFVWATILGFPQFALILVLFALVISIFYKGTIDPDLLIRKSTLYTIIALFMTVTFIAAEGIITSQAVVHLGASTQLSAITAGSITALLFGPVRNKVETKVNHLVDRMLPASALAEGSRYEAAVAFNDLSGYTRLTEESEDKALTLASLFHKEGLKAVDSWGGRIVKTIGDAILMEFNNAETAVRAVRQLHTTFHEACAKMALPHLPVHSGIHLGIVVKAKDGDIYGSTVNVAARLEGVAAPDEIILSNTARERIKSPQLQFSSAGRQALKNVSEPIPCFRLT